jgi:hypothetical protein
VPAEDIDQWESQQSEPTILVVHRSAGPALRLFFACGTQWRTGGMAGLPTGLDYAGTRAAASALGIAWTPRLLGDLTALEAGALKAFAERAAVK